MRILLSRRQEDWNERRCKDGSIKPEKKMVCSWLSR